MASRIVVLVMAVLLSFPVGSAVAATLCPLPDKAIEQRLSGSGGIEVVVTAPGSFTARVLEVSSEVFLPTAQCMADHADLIFRAKALAQGSWKFPLEFCPNKDVATCPSSSRAVEHNGQPVRRSEP